MLWETSRKGRCRIHCDVKLLLLLVVVLVLVFTYRKRTPQLLRAVNQLYTLNCKSLIAQPAIY